MNRRPRLHRDTPPRRLPPEHAASEMHQLLAEFESLALNGFLTFTRAGQGQFKATLQLNGSPGQILDQLDAIRMTKQGE